MLTDGRSSPSAGQDPSGGQDTWRRDWRREPEITAERQAELTIARKIEPNIKEKLYPFAGVKLSRADVEWLLATHRSNGMDGPVKWGDKEHEDRTGLDLRGADLESVDLSDLPLARTLFSLNYGQWATTTMAQTDAAKAKLDGVRFDRAHLEGALMVAVSCRRGSLEAAHLEGADLQLATFEQSWLASVHLERANLRLSRFPSAWLAGAHLAGANLHGASFDKTTNLEDVVLASSADGYARLTDVHWGDANLGVIEWARLRMLGEEEESRVRQAAASGKEDRAQRLDEIAVALRGTRQLSAELRRQGLSEDADRFALRGYALQRGLYRRQGRWSRYLGSLLLAAVAGYGYRPIRSVATYAVIIAGFAVAFYFLSRASGPQLDPLGASVFSVTSFHGRGFSPSPGESVALTNPLTVLAAGEAILGLVIEITFIATFTQRLFSK